MAQVDFDDDKVGNRTGPLKFKKDTWNRFAILDQKAEYVKGHYFNGHRICTAAPGPHQDPHGRCAYCQNLTKDAYDRFAVNVCSYVTDPEGQPYGDLGPRSFKIDWWPFDATRWQTIRMFKKTYGNIRQRDLLFHCTEESYQKGDLHVAPDNAWWLLNTEFRDIVIARYKTERHDLAAKLARYLGYDQQLAEMAEKAAAVARPGQGGYQGRGQGGQPQFNPAAVQGMLAPPGGPPVGRPPMFNLQAGSQPRFTQQTHTDTSVLTMPVANSQQKTTNSGPTNPTPPDPMAELDAIEGTPPPTGGNVDTTDLDKMLEDMTK